MSSIVPSIFSILQRVNTWTVSQLFAAGALLYADNCTKAWVVFNGTGTVAVIDGVNVIGITDNGVGDYTVNISAGVLANGNYCVSGCTQDAGSGNILSTSLTTAPTATACRVVVHNATVGNVDNARINVNCTGKT